MTAILKHGATTPLLTDNSYDSNLAGLDTASLVYACCASRDAYKVGQAAPGYAGLIIDKVGHKQDGDEWELSLSCNGIYGNKGQRQSLGYPKTTINQEDFDGVEDEVISASRSFFHRGGFGAYGGSMICVSASSEPINYSKTYWRNRGRFLGIIEQKPYKRQITCNNKVITGDSITWPLEGGWGTAQKASVALPSVVVSDTYLTTNAPQTGRIPGAQSPPNPPSIRFINATTTDPRYYWPNGWGLTVQAEQVAGVSLWRVTYIYEYQHRILPA